MLTLWNDPDPALCRFSKILTETANSISTGFWNTSKTVIFSNMTFKILAGAKKKNWIDCD